MRIKKLLAAVLTSMIVFSMTAMTATATETTSADPTATVAPTDAEASTTDAAATVAPTEAAADPYSGVGCYMGFFQIQTTTWVYRNNFTVKEYSEGGYDTIKGGPEGETNATEVIDTVIDGDGEYSVALKNIDFKDSTNYNMLALSTNIPLDAGISITSSTLYQDGMEIMSNATQKNDVKDYILMMFINQYDNKMKDTVNTVVHPAGSNLEIKFTVEGFGYPKKVADESATTDATVTATPEVTSSTEDAAATEETTANVEDEGKDGLSTGAIVGIVAGVLVVIIIGFIVINAKKKKG